MRRKILVIATCALLITVLAPFVYYYLYVPYVLGRQYVLVSFEPGFCSYGQESEFVNGLFEGKPFSMGWLAIVVNVTNRYFIPVHIRYNGFDIVWLIYDQTVSDPSDVMNNRRFLIWGAYYHLVFTSYQDPRRGVYDFSEDTIEYYANRRELSNFTITIELGQYLNNSALFADRATTPGAWTCQYWFNQSSHVFVPLGTYYMYCIIFGIQIGPKNLTLTSISYP